MADDKFEPVSDSWIRGQITLARLHGTESMIGAMTELLKARPVVEAAQAWRCVDPDNAGDGEAECAALCAALDDYNEAVRKPDVIGNAATAAGWDVVRKPERDGETDVTAESCYRRIQMLEARVNMLEMESDDRVEAAFPTRKPEPEPTLDERIAMYNERALSPEEIDDLVNGLIADRARREGRG